VDTLSDVLDRAGARSTVIAVLGRDSPWGMEFSGADPLAVHVLLRGRAGLVRGVTTTPIGQGDVILVRGGEPYLLASSIVAPRETFHCEAARRESTSTPRPGEPPSDHMLLCGTYTLDDLRTHRLLDAMPTEVVLRGDHLPPGLDTIIGILRAEAAAGAPGRQAALDSALGLLVLHVLRNAALRGADEAPGWLRALEDPALATALDAVHGSLSADWTVASMADHARLSRASFARRFAQAVGETPIAYVTGLRVDRAEHLLLHGHATLSAIAAATGFSSEFALADAFKRRHGIAPGRWRRIQG